MNDLEKMSEMAKKDMDISLSTNVISADKVKQGGKITFGVDHDSFNKIISQMATGNTTHYVAMYVINKKQFDELK